MPCGVSMTEIPLEDKVSLISSERAQSLSALACFLFSKEISISSFEISSSFKNFSLDSVSKSCGSAPPNTQCLFNNLKKLLGKVVQVVRLSFVLSYKHPIDSQLEQVQRYVTSICAVLKSSSREARIFDVNA